MQALTFMAEPHALQASTSKLMTRLRRYAQVIGARRSAGVGGSSVTRALGSSAPICRRH